MHDSVDIMAEWDIPDEDNLHVTTACPRCGFDLEADKPCRVCGFLPTAASAADSASRYPANSAQPVRHPGPPQQTAAAPRRAPSPSAPRSSTQGPIVVLASAAIGLLAVVGVFILGDMRTKPPADDAGVAAVTATAPVPSAATPASPSRAADAVPAAVPAPLPDSSSLSRPVH